MSVSDRCVGHRPFYKLWGKRESFKVHFKILVQFRVRFKITVHLKTVVHFEYNLHFMALSYPKEQLWKDIEYLFQWLVNSLPL
jgi:hypothetical protein